MHRILLGLIAFVSFHFLALPSSSSKVNFQSLNVKEGLSQGAVSCIWQDQKGFMWFGTYKGLNRFDGQAFKTFNHNNDDTTTLSNDAIRAIFEDKYGFIWVGTHRGLNRFDPHTGKCQRFYNEPTNPNSPSHNTVVEIVASPDGTLWCGTWGGGIFSLNPRTLKFTTYQLSKLPGLTGASDIVLSLFPISNEELWICTLGDGLLRYNVKNHELDQFLNGKGGEGHVEMNSFRCMTQINENHFLIGGADSKVFMFNVEAGSFNLLFEFLGRHQPVKEVDIVDIIKGEGGAYWIATEGIGLYRFVPQNHQVDQYQNIRYNQYSMPHNILFSLYKSRDGILWVGTADGVAYIDKHFKKFDLFSLDNLPPMLESAETHFFHPIDSKSVYMGISGSGIVEFNSENYGFKLAEWPLNMENLQESNIHNMILTPDGHYVLGSRNGVYVVNLEGHVDHYQPGDEENSLQSKYVYCSFQDSKGRIWFGTDQGLEQFDLETQKFFNYKAYPIKSSEAFKNLVWDIKEDYEGQMWVATDGGGLCKFDPQKRIYTRRYMHDNLNKTSISMNRVVSLHEDSKNRLWVGTSEGLNLFDRETGSFKRLTMKDGLKNDVIFSIQEDDKGHIWLATASSLVDLDPISWSYIEYDHSDGLQSNEFLHDSKYKFPDGRMLFGGRGGFNIFHPDSLSFNKNVPFVVITEMKILNKELAEYARSSGKDFGDTLMPYKSQIQLSHNENSFSLQFAVLNYSLPSKNQVKYRLRGFDQQWIRSEENMAVYTNIPPGKYILEVIGSNNDGVWNMDGAQLEIRIKPPFWKTAYAYLIAFTAMILLIYVFIAWRTKLLRLQKNKLLKAVEQRTEELSATNSELEERQEEIEMQNEEILSQNSEITRQRDEISQKNQELQNHKNNLERLVQDRTQELSIAKSKAEEANRLKTAFLSNLSHEIRTPMNAILGFSTMLNYSGITSKEKEEYINIIRTNSEDLLLLINDLIDIAQIETGQFSTKKEILDLVQVIDEVVEQFIVKASAKGLQFEWNGNKGSEAKAYIDAARFKQVLRNLLDNAVKFTDEGYVRVSITLSEYMFPDEKEISLTDKYWLISVYDTGIGIPKEELELIFERFEKSEQLSHKVYRGTGLGLTISEKLVNLLGGRIWVDSSEGDYTNFQFTVPACLKDQRGQLKEASEAANKISYDWADKSFLLAEDEYANYILVDSILKKTGADLYWAKNGEEAIKVLRQHPEIDMGIIDIKMPVMDGFEFMDCLQKELESNMPPMIAFTAYTLGVTKKNFLSHGFADYLFKPVKPKELLRILHANMR